MPVLLCCEEEAELPQLLYQPLGAPGATRIASQARKSSALFASHAVCCCSCLACCHAAAAAAVPDLPAALLLLLLLLTLRGTQPCHSPSALIRCTTCAKSFVMVRLPQKLTCSSCIDSSLIDELGGTSSSSYAYKAYNNGASRIVVTTCW